MSALDQSGAPRASVPDRSREASPLAAPPSALRRTLPNWLTGSRVVMAAVFFGVLTAWRFEGSEAAALRTDWWLISAAGLFIVACLTDVLDGRLARRWNVESTFGRIMDPFADKVLVIGALVFLAGPDFWWRTPEVHAFSGRGIQLSGVYPWMVVVILGRELLVTSIRGVLESRGVNFGADWWGKAKMIVQSVAIPTVLVATAVTNVEPASGGGPWGRLTIDITVWVTVAVTVFSGVPYVFRCISLLGAWHKARREQQAG